jgi:putative acyl-CoA dehydrogenase
MECLGGAGYVEESPMPRLFRESPLNAIWEGSGNVIALDILRTLAREPDAFEAFGAELASASDSRLDRAARALIDRLASGLPGESEARAVAEQLALLLQAALIIRHAPRAVSDFFIATRIERGGGLSYGAVPPGLDVRAVLDRQAVS